MRKDVLWRWSKAILSWSLALALIVALVYGLREEREKLWELVTISARHVVFLAGLYVLLSLLGGLNRKFMARQLGVRLSFLDWYGFLVLTNLISLVVPARGDLLVSAAYLRRKYSLPVAHFASMVYGNAVLLAGVLGVEGCLGLLLLGLFDGVWNMAVWAIVLLAGAAAVPLALMSKSVLKGDLWLVQKLRMALEGWEVLRSNRRLLTGLAFLLVAGSVCFTAWMYVSYAALGFRVRLLPAFFAGISAQLSFFLSLTPGNLGLREIMVGFVSQVTGLGFAEGVAVTVLQRGVSTAVQLVLGGAFSPFIVRSLVDARRAAHMGAEKDSRRG